MKSLLLRTLRSSDAILILYFDRYLFPRKVMKCTRGTDWEMIKRTQCLGVQLLGQVHRIAMLSVWRLLRHRQAQPAVTDRPGGWGPLLPAAWAEHRGAVCKSCHRTVGPGERGMVFRPGRLPLH